MTPTERTERLRALARSRGDRAAGLILGDLELTQLAETGETNVYVGVPAFAGAIAARDALADQLRLARASLSPLGLEDENPVVGFRVAA